jgi:hypothetical protein
MLFPSLDAVLSEILRASLNKLVKMEVKIELSFCLIKYSATKAYGMVKV